MGFTMMAFFTLKEIVLNYIYKNSFVYAALIDLTKASDKVNHFILFVKLVDIGDPIFYVAIIWSVRQLVLSHLIILKI